MLRTAPDVWVEFSAREAAVLSAHPDLFYRRLAARLQRLDATPGKRVYTEAYIQVSKKAGKSTMASAHCLYFLLADGEPGAEVYSAAVARDQARIVFGQARSVVLASPRLLDWVKVYRDALAVESTDSVYRVLSADAGVQEGLNPSATVIDELHRHKSRDLYDVLTSGDIAREQPFTLSITNAGVDLTSICGQVFLQARDVLDGKPLARTDLFAFVPQLATADLDDRSKWTGPGSPNPASWITLDLLERSYRRFPLFVFRRRNLNHWTSSESSWLPAGAWDACYAPDLTIDAGDAVWLGLDMGLKHDTAGRIIVAPKDGRIVVRARSWGVHADPEKPPPPAHVLITDSDRISFDLVENDIRDCARAQHLREGAYDPWRFERSAQTLTAEGIPMLEFPQSHARMCPASQTLFDLIVQGVIAHDGDPILAAHVEASVAKDTGRGWRLVKRETVASGAEEALVGRRPVDLTIALAMAVSRAQTQPGAAAIFFMTD